MNKKHIIAIATICVIGLVVGIFLLSDNDPVKETKWIGENNSVLSFEDGYAWTVGEDYAKGKYKAYTGSKAKQFLDEFKKDYLSHLDDSIPEGERYGFEDEIDQIKQELKSGAFIIEEKIDETVIGGESISPQNNVYSASITTSDGVKFLSLANIRTHKATILREYTGEIEESETGESVRSEENVEKIEDIGFAYDIPEGYITSYSEKDYLCIVNGEKMLSVSAIRETPLYGIIDEHPNAAEYTANVEGYRCEEQMGPFISYIFLFEDDGTTYYVEGNDKADFEKFAKSIKA